MLLAEGADCVSRRERDRARPNETSMSRTQLPRLYNLYIAHATCRNPLQERWEAIHRTRAQPPWMGVAKAAPRAQE
jgi:hypothetical protein